MSKQKIFQLVESIVFIVVGILVACSILNQNMLNVLVGVVILVLGIFLLVKAGLESSKINLLLPVGIGGAILVGAAVAMFVSKLDIMGPITLIVKIGIASVGVLFLIDSVIRFIKNATNNGIVEVVIGAILLTLGLCLLLINEFGQYLWVIAGSLFAVFGVYLFIMTLIDIKK